MHRHSHIFSLLGRGLFVITAGIAAFISIRADAQQSPDSVEDLSTLRRVVQVFDFEERKDAPYVMPVHFHRVLSQRTVDNERGGPPGFPPFGRMELADDAWTGGQWSLRYDLDGGSMAARVPSAVINVMPYASYAVTAQVRTQGLKVARARLSAWFHDVHGDIIDASRSQSQLVRTDGHWMDLSVLLSGDFEDAADLGLELQLLQPSQFGKLDLAGDRPTLEDVTGSAWFDDVVIWQLPRIHITTGSPGNIIAAPDPPVINLLIRDLASDTLTARLRVYDYVGDTVFNSAIDLPSGTRPTDIELPIATYGWYRAILDLSGSGRLVERRVLDFAYAAPVRKIVREQASFFGVILDEPTTETLKELHHLLQRIGASAVTLPVWEYHSWTDSAEERERALFQAVQRSLDNRIDTTFALKEVPFELSEALSVAPVHILEVLNMPFGAWRPGVARILARFSDRAQRWTFGGPDLIDRAFGEEMIETGHAVHDSLSQVIAGPIVISPWPPDEFLIEQPNEEFSYRIVLPSYVAPEELDAYLPPANGDGQPPEVLIDYARREPFSPRQRVTDLALRTLYAWRAGLSRLNIYAPWRDDSVYQSDAMPDPEFLAWRTLTEQLYGRTVTAEISLDNDVRCWILESSDDAVLVGWNTTANSDTRPINVLLGSDVVTMVDVFGNQTEIELINGTHEIPLGAMPVFVEGIDPRLARFRGSFAIEPSFMSAQHRIHEHEVVLRNPWESTLTGSLVLDTDAGFRFSPARRDFTIRPGEELRLPMDIIVARKLTAGTYRIDALLDINADRSYVVQAHADLEIGLENIEFSATRSAVRNDRTGELDLLVTVFVKNTGKRSINLDTFLLAPGFSRKSTSIVSLTPGDLEIRNFRLANGALTLAGQSIQVGVLERDGSSRLSKSIEIPISGTSVTNVDSN